MYTSPGWAVPFAGVLFLLIGAHGIGAGDEMMTVYPRGHRKFGRRHSIAFFFCLLVQVMALLGVGDTSSIRGGLAL